MLSAVGQKENRLSALSRVMPRLAVLALAAASMQRANC
jgi:hypothetical protein